MDCRTLGYFARGPQRECAARQPMIVAIPDAHKGFFDRPRPIPNRLSSSMSRGSKSRHALLANSRRDARGAYPPK